MQTSTRPTTRQERADAERKRQHDALPENVRWKDHNKASECRVSRTCLDCPLAVCVHDSESTVTAAEYKRAVRDLGFIELYAGGMRVEDIAAKADLSARTIHRVIHDGPEEPRSLIDSYEAQFQTSNNS